MTLQTSVVIMYNTFSVLTSPHHTNRKVLYVKIDNHNNRSNINIKMLNSETVPNLEKVYLHFLLK
jgi:hypothetical protein